MNYKYRILALLALAIIAVSCAEDEPKIFDQPTISVVADNNTPFADEEIVFTVAVAAPGGLKEIKLDGQVIKTYTGGEKSDEFEHTYDLPTGTSLGNKSFSFTVADDQKKVKENMTTYSVTVQDPEARGNPLMWYDFNGILPNGTVKAITRDIGGNPWENAYDLTVSSTDPTNAANKVLQADRKGAHEWYYQGGGSVFIEFTNSISEDDIDALVSGERVLQMNIYFKEVPKLITAHKDPANPDGPTKQTNVNMSWMFNYTNDAAVTGVPEVWDFEQQDSLKGAIPIAIQLGNKGQWDWNGGYVQGKKFYLVGSLKEKNGWQTVTFSRMVGTITDTGSGWTYNNYKVGPQSSTASAALHDPTVGLDQINYVSIILNNRKTGFPNTYLNPGSPWYEMPGDGNGWNSGNIVGISDDHNSYYIDNLRTIDAADYDKNPNQ